MSQWSSHTFELFPGRTLSLVAVAAPLERIHAAVIARALDVALLDPSVIVDTRCILVAANKALHAAAHTKMRSASLHGELVLCLYARRNVGDALRALGATKSSAVALVAVFDADAATMEHVESLADGSLADAASIITRATDESRVRALYGITLGEVGSLSDAVIGRIALQDISP